MNICIFCEKEYKNSNAHKNHERRCPQNPNRVYTAWMKGKTAWNKGLTKESSPILAESSKKYKAKIDSGEIVCKRNTTY